MRIRLAYVDEIKGLLIFLVVFGHLVQELAREGTYHPFFNSIYAFHMPCFMFITGYLAYSTFRGSNMKQLASGIADKATTILLPYYTWPILVHGLALSDKWNWDIWARMKDLTVGWSPWWFLKFVFVYYFVYAIALALRNITRIKTNLALDCAVYLSGLVAFLVLRGKISGLDSYILHGIFFFSGIICAKHEALRRWSMNKHVVFLATSLFFIGICKYDYHDQGFVNKLIKILVSFSAIPLFFSGFTSSRTDSIIKRTLGRYGKGTLAIYVSHFCILGLISNDPLQIDFLLLVILSIVLSIIIIETCLWVKSLCRVSPHLNFILYGGKISVLFDTGFPPKHVPGDDQNKLS